MKALLSVVLALALAPAAHAKGCARIDTSAPVVAHKPARITLTTLRPPAMEPYADGIVAMSVYVTPAFGTPVLLPLTRHRGDRSRWSARFAFPRAGTWWISSTALPEGLPPRCSGRKKVVVRRR